MSREQEDKLLASLIVMEQELDEHKVEIERLRADLEAVRAGWDGEIEIAAGWKKERDEAREAARWLWSLNLLPRDAEHDALARWPWLEE